MHGVSPHAEVVVINHLTQLDLINSLRTYDWDPLIFIHTNVHSQVASNAQLQLLLNAAREQISLV